MWLIEVATLADWADTIEADTALTAAVTDLVCDAGDDLAVVVRVRRLAEEQ